MKTIHYNSKLARLLTCLTDTNTIMFFGFILTEAESLDIRTLAHERTHRLQWVFTRVKGGKLGVYAYIDGMTPKHLHTWYEESQFNLFKVCVPAGMKVDIHSASEVTTGKTLTEETA